MEEKKNGTLGKEGIERIRKDIEAYERAIENAEGALAEAERELEEALIDEYGKNQ